MLAQIEVVKSRNVGTGYGSRRRFINPTGESAEDKAAAVRAGNGEFVTSALVFEKRSDFAFETVSSLQRRRRAYFRGALDCFVQIFEFRELI